MVMGKVQHISTKQTGINYFAESGMTSGGKRHEAGQGIYFTGQRLGRCLTGK